MKITRTEIRDTVPDASAHLSSPHFDELAVAVAQPVQPLLPRPKRKSLRTPLLLIAYLAFIVTVVGIAYLKPPGTQADTLSDGPNNESQLDMQPALNDGSAATGDASVAAPSLPRIQPHSRRRSIRRMRIQHPMLEIGDSDEGKPIPRKVGEIRYGRSPDRP